MAHIPETNRTPYHEVPMRVPSMDSLNMAGQKRQEQIHDKDHEYGYEHRPIDVPTPVATGMVSPQQATKSPRRIVVKMLIFYIVALALMGGHAAFFIWLDGQAVSAVGVSQAYQTTIGNIFAIAAEISLLGGVGVAYDQFLWRMFRRKTLKAGTIDRLVGLAGNPWDLLSLDILKEASPAAFIGLLCALFPVAASFPPGAVTVEFVNRAVPETLRNVPTMNISDFGDGTPIPMVERCFLELEGSLSALEHKEMGDRNQISPRLLSMALQVLSSGQPVLLPSPCDGPCAYSLPISGPRFHCEEASSDEALISEEECEANLSVVYRAVDKAERVGYTMTNNSFVMSWYEDAGSDECGIDRQRTLDCSMTMANYVVDIETFQNQSRTIKVDLKGEDEVWTKDQDIMTSFHDYFLLEDALDDPATVWELVGNFGVTQAYAISRAATAALEGELIYVWDGVSPSFRGNATTITGSPYIGFDDKIEAKFIITAETIEQYLQDLVISTIALNFADRPIWVNNEDITAMTGAEVYIFESKLQFYVPYAACLAITAALYIIGLWSLRKNGVSAESGFLQFATTTSSGGALNHAAYGCSAGGGENMTDELKNLKLRFGVLNESPHDGPYEVGGRGQCLVRAGFGTESELKHT